MLKKSLYGLAALVLGFESASALTLPVSQIPASALTTITNQPLGFTVRTIGTDDVDTGNNGIFNNAVPFFQALGPVSTNTVNGLPSAGLVPSAATPGFYATNAANFLGANNPGWAGILAADSYNATVDGSAIAADANGFWAFNAANFTNAYINCDANAGADDNNGPFVSNLANGSTNTAANYPKNYFPGVPTTVGDGNSYENVEVSFAGYMFLPAGTVTFNANSDDYTQVLVSPLLNPQDASGQIVVIPFTAGGRGSATSTEAVTVPSSGWYSVRVDFEQGTGGIVCAFFTTDAKGNNVLVNDTTQPTALLAYPTPDLWAEPYLVSSTPANGAIEVAPISPVSIQLQDGTNAAIKASSVAITINGVPATAADLVVAQIPSFTPTGLPYGNVSTITYTPTISTLLPVNKAVTFVVTYSDVLGASHTNSLSFATAASLLQNTSGVDQSASNRGFYVYPYFTSVAAQPNEIVWTELQMQGFWQTNGALFATWPYADFGARLTNGYIGSAFIWTNYINWDISGATATDGDFQSVDGVTGYPKSEFPGIEFANYPDETDPNAGAYFNNNFSMLCDTWLYFPTAGAWTMIVTSDDGFVVKSGSTPGDFFGTALGMFDGGRGWVDTDFTVGITQPGYYPFELLYEEGGGGANCEWISIDLATGAKQLINDSTNPVQAFLNVSNSPPFIFEVWPTPDVVDGLANPQNALASQVPPYPNIQAYVANGNGTGRAFASGQLYLNGTAVTTTATASTNGVTILSATNANYTAGFTNVLTVVYTDAGKVSYTNSWTVTPQILTPVSDTLHGYVGFLQGNSVYTANGGGHTGKPGDYAIDNTAAATGDMLVPNAQWVNTITSNDVMAVSLWNYRYSINASSGFWFMSPSAGSSDRGFQAHMPWSDDNIYFDTDGCCDGAAQRINADINTFAPYNVVGNDTWWNQWHFFVFSKNGATDKEIWIDGQLFLQGSSTDPLPTDIFEFFVGGGQAGSEDGKFDDFAIYSNALVVNGVDGGSVSNLFSGAITPAKVPGVMAYWDFNEPAGGVTPPPGGPTLSITLSGSNILLSYPSTPSGFSLIGTTNLVGGTWVPITTAPVTSGGVSTVTLPAPAVDWFFQLKN
jgi:hypothetical protein